MDGQIRAIQVVPKGADASAGGTRQPYTFSERLRMERERITGMLPQKMSTEELRARSDRLLGITMIVVEENLLREDPVPEDFPINPETRQRDGYYKEQMRTDTLRMNSERTVVAIQRIVAQREAADQAAEGMDVEVDSRHRIGGAKKQETDKQESGKRRVKRDAVDQEDTDEWQD